MTVNKRFNGRFETFLRATARLLDQSSVHVSGICHSSLACQRCEWCLVNAHKCVFAAGSTRQLETTS